MYFGYSQMWRFTFVPVGFVIVMATFIALCLVYAVGASRGPRGAASYVNVSMVCFWTAIAVDLVYAAVSGQLTGFARAYGVSPLVEMAVLSALCIGSMWFMAVSYVVSKQREASQEAL